MGAQPDLQLTYRGHERRLRWGAPRFEFGARTHTGLIIGLRSADQNRYLHGVCGWFECVGGWVVERRTGTANVDMRVRTGAIDTALDPGAAITLQRGRGRLVIAMRSDPRSTIEIGWDLDVLPEAKRSAPSASAGRTLPLTDTRDSTVNDLIPISAFQLEVVHQVLRWQGPARVTHRDIAQALDAEVRQVRKAIELLTAKIRAVEPDALPPSPGVGGAEAIVEWLVRRGIVQRPSAR